MQSRTPFLTARWENLVLLNFEADASLLESRVPPGTELDAWQGTCIVSLVGFQFVDTRVAGIPIPCHRTFEEVNLRFYVLRRMPDGSSRRGVVFIKELVPRRAIAALARIRYNEPYIAVPMGHQIELSADSGGAVAYSWVHRGSRHRLSATVEGGAKPLTPGSEAEFITEHYWGYCRQRDGDTLEYQVEHPRWRVWTAVTSAYSSPPESRLYAPEFAEILSQRPRSALVAPGSEVMVFAGRRIRNGA